jgi:hypothetical protein
MNTMDTNSKKTRICFYLRPSACISGFQKEPEPRIDADGRE